MESKNMFQKNTSKVQQAAVISKIHNLQWLKSNASSPGHVKPKANKETIKSLKEDFESSELTNKHIMSVPNIPANINIKSVNSTNIVSTTNDSKYNYDIESKIDERSFVLESEKCTWDMEDKMERSSLLNNQELLLRHLEEEEVISIAIEKSIFALQLEPQLRLEGEERNTATCNLASSEMEDNKNKIIRENIHDNNNNDKSDIINESHLIPDIKMKNDSEMNDIKSDTIINEVGANKEDQSNISLNMKTDTLLNLNNLDEVSVVDDNTCIPTQSTTINSNDESKEVHVHVIKKDLEKKEVSKVITKKNAPISTLNKINNVILRQSTENKMKNGIKQTIKNYSVEVAKRAQDKKDHLPNQSSLNTSKGLKSKCNLQPKKESAITKHSSEVTSSHVTKNVKENEQNKSTPINTVSKQYKVSRMCYTNKKEENGSISKIQNNSPKPKPRTIINSSNSSNSIQSANKKSFCTAEVNSTSKKILETSNTDNKNEDTKQNVTLKNDQTTTLASREESVNESGIKDKLPVDTISKEICTFPNEMKENIESGTTNFPNEQSTNEYVEPKINTNPFLQDLSAPNKADAKDDIDIAHNNLSSQNTQLNNIPFTNIPYVYHVSQQNAHQEQIPLNQNFIHYVPNQFVMDCSVNNALPKFHSDVPYSNANTMHLKQYGNIQTMPNNSSDAQLQNSSCPNVLPPNTENVNTLQYQMPNVLPYNGQTMIRPPPSFCIRPMSQEEQFNLHAYGLSPTYFMNPVCVCRNDCYSPHPQNWNLPNNYPVPLLQSPYHFNCNSFFNQNVQPNNMIHKNTASIRPTQNRTQAQIPREQNLQRNSGKPSFNSGHSGRNSQNNKRYNPTLQAQGSMTNTRESVDFKKERQDSEFFNDNEMNNLPMISPKACMIYGSGLSTSANTVKPQMKYNETTVQYQKNNGCRYVPKEYFPSNAGIDRGTTRCTQKRQQNQPSYKAQH